MKKKLLALLAAMCLTLLACELALRMFWHNSYAGASSELVQRIRVENANRSYIVDRHELDSETSQVWFRTDQRAYLRPSFQYAEPDATVAFLGGSTTQCVAVQEHLRFPAMVSDLLAEKGLKVNTLNAARAANTLHDSINILLNHLSADHPDVVVVMHVTNDIGVLSGDGGYGSRMGSRMSWSDSFKWFSQALSSHVYLAAVARKAMSDSEARQRDPTRSKWRNDPAQADKLPIDEYEKRLRALVHLARDFGIQPVLVTEPLIYSTSQLAPDWGNLGAQDRFNALVCRVGKDENVPVIDLVKHLYDNVPDWNKEMEIFYDGAHVTDKGSQVYARYLAEQLEPLVRKVVAGRAAKR